MKMLLFLLLISLISSPLLAQQRLNYTLLADGLVNPQLAKSSLYAMGVGVRGEVSKPLRNPAFELFAQAGYAHFFQKSTSAFVANIGLVNVGYRYQSRKAFWASVGVGAQYWNERMRVRFADYAVDETINAVMPAVIVGLGARIKSRYRLGVEYRGLFEPEDGGVLLRNNVAFSIGYTF
ncbi:hypothetical protein [Spirosoma areae]